MFMIDCTKAFYQISGVLKRKCVFVKITTNDSVLYESVAYYVKVAQQPTGFQEI